MVASDYWLGSVNFDLEEAPVHLNPSEMGIAVTKRISAQKPVGATGYGATVRTWMGDESPIFPVHCERVFPATIQALLALFNSFQEQVWKSPWNLTGFNVLILEFKPLVIRGYVPATLERYELDMVLERRSA